MQFNKILRKKKEFKESIIINTNWINKEHFKITSCMHFFTNFIIINYLISVDINEVKC